MRRLIGIILVCFTITVLFSGCGVLQKLGLIKGDSEELTPASSIVMGESDALKLSDKLPVHIYFANEDYTKLSKEIRYVKVSEAKKSSSALATLIVKELLKGPTANTGLKATIPTGTSLRAPVKIEAGIATVDFTKEFKTKHPGGGKAAEQATIYSIVNSLTEMKDIQKVRFLIDGKTSKEYLGNFKFDAPFPRTPSLISKDPPVTSSPSGTVTDPAAKDKDTKQTDPAKKDDGSKNNKSDGSAETSGDTTGNAEETYIELNGEEEVLE